MKPTLLRHILCALIGPAFLACMLWLGGYGFNQRDERAAIAFCIGALLAFMGAFASKSGDFDK